MYSLTLRLVTVGLHTDLSQEEKTANTRFQKLQLWSLNLSSQGPKLWGKIQKSKRKGEENTKNKEKRRRGEIKQPEKEMEIDSGLGPHSGLLALWHFLLIVQES